MSAKFSLRFELPDSDGESYDVVTADTIRWVAKQVEAGRTGGNVRDANGSTIGTWKLR